MGVITRCVPRRPAYLTRYATRTVGQDAEPTESETGARAVTDEALPADGVVGLDPHSSVEKPKAEEPCGYARHALCSGSPARGLGLGLDESLITSGESRG